MGGSILGAEFPLRKGIGMGGSSRFSAGPRSQVNYMSLFLSTHALMLESMMAGLTRRWDSFFANHERTTAVDVCL